MAESCGLTIVPAVEADTGVILSFIRQLAEYEHLAHEVAADESSLRQHLFGPRPAAEVLLARIDKQTVGFALYFTTFSTFAGRPGIWLEDLFVLPSHRRQGIGKALLREVASIAQRRNCARLEWSVLDCECAGDHTLPGDGRDPHERLDDPARHRRGAARLASASPV